MKAHLTERFVKAAEPDPVRNIIVRDDEVIGFGIRVTTGGAKSFVLSYTIAGRERRITIERASKNSYSATPTCRSVYCCKDFSGMSEDIHTSHTSEKFRRPVLLEPVARLRCMKKGHISAALKIY